MLTNNTVAKAVYARAGFVQRRDLGIFNWDGKQPTLESSRRAYGLDVERLLPHAARLHDTSLSWQREPESIAATPGLTGLALGASDAPSAYVIYEATDTGLCVVDLAAEVPDEIVPLLDALAMQFPGKWMSLSNEPAESQLIEALEQHGWREVLRQHEMVWTAKSSGSPPARS